MDLTLLAKHPVLNALHTTGSLDRKLPQQEHENLGWPRFGA
jgi:hypothetical protein